MPTTKSFPAPFLSIDRVPYRQAREIATQLETQFPGIHAIPDMSRVYQSRVTITIKGLRGTSNRAKAVRFVDAMIDQTN